jgi:hypothetical protein
MRRVTAVGIVLLALTLGSPAARAVEAGGVRAGFGASSPLPPPARTPSVLRGGDPGIERFDDRRSDRPHRPGRPVIVVVPQTVFVTPTYCWQPGYWTYQLDASGYYQPAWVEGYYTSC